MNQELSEKPKSFIYLGVDDNGDIAFDLFWGDTTEDVKRFSVLLAMLVTGEINEEMKEALKKLSIKEKRGKAKLKIVEDILNSIAEKFDEESSVYHESDEVVIDPRDVELF